MSISKYYVQKGKDAILFAILLLYQLLDEVWIIACQRTFKGTEIWGKSFLLYCAINICIFFKFKGFHDNVSATAVLLGISHGNSMGGNVWMEVLIRHESSHQSFMRLLTAYVQTMIFPNLLRHTRQIKWQQRNKKPFEMFFVQIIEIKEDWDSNRFESHSSHQGWSRSLPSK